MKPLDSPADFHRLDSRLRLVGRLTTRTALHVGAASDGGQDIADMPVLKDGRGRPFIPGASLKGVLRSTIESLVRAAEDRHAGIWACDPLSGEACGDHGPGERNRVDIDQHCTVCRLLGSHVLSSHVRISDAMMRLDDGERSPIELRDGVAIDRDLARIAGSKKYQFEVVAPGVGFDLEVFVENPRPWLMGLLTIGWDQIADGYSAVGGFSSRGLGRLELHWDEGQRFTATSILAGEEPTRWGVGELWQQRESWRAALAERVKGGQHVQA